MNNTKLLFQRIYSALTVGLLSAFLMINSVPFSFGSFSYMDVGINMLLSLGICWIATRQNKPAHFKWYTGIMFVLTFLYIYLPRLFHGLFSIGFPSEYLGWIVLGCYWICIIISSYQSNTKYYNIFPNQNKGVSYLLRGLSWTGQIIIWGYLFLILLFAIRGIFK